MLVDLIYIDAGGGHRACAQALQVALEAQRPEWTIRPLNLFQILDPRNRFRKLTGMAPEDFYNKRLSKGWTMGMAQELKLLQFSVSLLHEPLRRSLQAHWVRTKPDLLVSLIPNFNRVLYESVKRRLPAVPFVTILTDLADHPPNFWIEPDQDQFFICGTAKSAEQARAMGYSPERIYRTSGMILHPKFYRSGPLDRDQERHRQGLDSHRPTGLVIFGGHGSIKMLKIAQRLDATQLILMCGRNRKLAEKLRVMERSAPRLIVEFTNEVSYYMALADFFIGKPGPGSISEAVAMGLPVIVERNAWTMPQEIYNTQWVLEQQVGVVIKSLGMIEAAAEQLVNDLPAYRRRLAGIENRAVFEIPQILKQIMARP